MRAYLEVVRERGVGRLLIAAVLGRLGATMLGVTLALGAAQQRGSLVEAGLVLAAHASCLAVFAPLGGRIADRLGARRTLAGYLAANLAAYGVLFVLLASGSGLQMLPAAAALAGATTPPSSAVLRGHWAAVVSAERLRTAYAIDSVSNSLMFVVGPPLAGVLVAVQSPALALAVVAAARLLGDLLLATTRGLAGPVRKAGNGRLLGALQDGQVRVLLTVAALDTFGLGCLDVLAVSYGMADASTTGLLLGVLSAGEVIGGLLYGARLWPGSSRRQLLALHLATAATVAVISPFEAVLMVGLFFLAAGISSGARDTLNQVFLSDVAPATHRTETFAWLNTLMWGGFAAGTALAGLAHSWAGTNAIIASAVIAALLAAMTTLRLSRAGTPAPAKTAVKA